MEFSNSHDSREPINMFLYFFFSKKRLQGLHLLVSYFEYISYCNFNEPRLKRVYQMIFEQN